MKLKRDSIIVAVLETNKSFLCKFYSSFGHENFQTIFLFKGHLVAAEMKEENGAKTHDIPLWESLTLFQSQSKSYMYSKILKK
jgi:hypothetical protein